MSVTIHCPHCGATGNAPDHILGQSVRCSKCKQSFVAGGEKEQEEERPDESEESSEESPADQFGDIDDMPSPPKRSSSRSRPSRSGGAPSAFGDVLMFRTMVAPWVIMVVFWLGVIGMVFTGLGMMISSFFTGNVLYIIGGIFGGILTIVFGIIWVRLLAELALIQFRIYERLKEISEASKPKP
jgi:hypothetical protein